MFHYAQDNKGWIPRDYNYPGANKAVTQKNPMLLVPERFSLYLGGSRPPLIPPDKEATTAVRDRELAKVFARMKILQCPSFPPWEGTSDPPPVVSSQAYDYVVNAFQLERTYVPLGGKPQASQLDKTPVPGQLFYLVDGNKDLQPDMYLYHDMFLSESLWWGTNPRMVDDQRHGGRVNGLFFDGHVYRPLIRAVTISFFTPYLDPTDPNNRPPT